MPHLINQIRTIIITIVAINLLNNIFCSQLPYNHAVNDCYHLCFTIESCVKECEDGFNSQSSPISAPPVKRRSKLRSYASGERILKQSKDAKHDEDVKETKVFTNFPPFESPIHCGLRTRAQSGKTNSRSRYSGIGMGRIVGGMDSLCPKIFYFNKTVFNKNQIQAKTQNLMNFHGLCHFS
jgi:hypothetical protein